jgi:hypothetical protein
MSDKLTNRVRPDRSKINMHEDHEVKYWTHALRVPKDHLQKAVDKVGNLAAAVRKELGLQTAVDWRAMKSNREIRASTAEILAVATFLIIWTVVETATGTGAGSHASPGATYHAAAAVGASVTPSEQPSALEVQPIKPAPAPRS